MYFLARAVALVAALYAAFHSLGLEQRVNPTNFHAQLGDHTYDVSKGKAPIVSGWALRALTLITTATPFGPAVRRFLINDNAVLDIRELAAQMPPGVVPLSFPVRRLNRKEREAHDATVADAKAAGTDLDSIIPFIKEPSVQKAASLSNSDVLAMHARFVMGSSTPTQVAEHTLERIKELQPVYKIFTAEPLRDEMLQAAAESSKRYAAGAPLSIFDGVPVAFKDMIAIRGYVMTDGSAFKRRFNAVASDDDLLVRRFRELGALILPPTSMVEGGVTPVGFCVDVQGPFNPYNASHYSGGSSGGSAVAVALGLVPVAIGYDGGGSIRTPAALSGVVGYATGYGRLPFSSHLTSTNIKGGPFTRTVADAALAFAVMARSLPNGDVSAFDELYDGGYLGVPEAVLSEYLKPRSSPGSKDLAGIRLGVMHEWFDDCEPAVRDAAWAGFAALVARGATVVDVSIPNLRHGRLSHALNIASEFALDWDAVVGHPEVGSLVEDNTKITVGLGAEHSAVELKSGEKMRAYLFAYLRDEVFSKVDAVVTPTVPISAPVVPPSVLARGENNVALNVELLKYVYVANFLGLPSVSVPVGVDATNDNMPVGLMMTGAWWQEDVVFRIAQACEASSSQNVPRPADFAAP